MRDSAPGIAVGISMITVWSAIALSYLSDWPVGFFVGAIGAVFYALGRVFIWRRIVPQTPLPGTKAIA